MSKTYYKRKKGTLEDNIDQAEVTSRRALKSKTFIGFRTARGHIRVGWAFRNGSNIRVKSFEDEEWKNRTVNWSNTIVIFEDLPKTDKNFKAHFTNRDFPLYKYKPEYESKNDRLLEMLFDAVKELLEN